MKKETALMLAGKRLLGTIVFVVAAVSVFRWWHDEAVAPVEWELYDMGVVFTSAVIFFFFISVPAHYAVYRRAREKGYTVDKALAAAVNIYDENAPIDEHIALVADKGKIDLIVEKELRSGKGTLENLPFPVIFIVIAAVLAFVAFVIFQA